MAGLATGSDWMRNWQGSIAVKITALVLYAIVLIGCAGAVFYLHGVEKRIERDFAASADGLAYRAAMLLAREPDISPEEVCRLLRDEIASAGFTYAALLIGSVEASIGNNSEGAEFTVRSIPTSGPMDAVLKLQYPSVQAAGIKQRNRIFAITGAVTLLFGCFLTWVILRFIAPPIKNLVSATRAVAEGDLQVRLDTNREDEFGDLSRFFNLMVEQIDRELTERCNVEEALRRSNEFIRTTLNSMNDAISVVDARDFHILAVNDAFLREVGLAEKEVIGKTCYEVTHHRSTPCTPPDDLCPVMETMANGRHAVAEHLHLDSSNKRCTVEVSTSPILGEGGEIVQFVHISRDITERKQTEEKLRRYAEEIEEQNDELNALVYMASHDLRAPLLNIKGFASELKTSLSQDIVLIEHCSTALPDAQRERLVNTFCQDVPAALNIINNSVNRIDTLVNSMLRLTRLGNRNLKPERVFLADIVDKAVSGLKGQSASSILFSVGTLPEVVADRKSMELIFEILLGNAVKYMVTGRQGQITINSILKDGDFVICVNDNGRGIPEEDRHKVFAFFRQAGRQDAPGEGMGLAYVRVLLRRHGGRIWFESEPGGGTSFFFSLPATCSDTEGKGRLS